jgi:hypothetical protein
VRGEHGSLLLRDWEEIARAPTVLTLCTRAGHTY